MKIRIKPEVTRLTEDEKKYLLLLEFHEDFDHKVNEIRSKAGKPIGNKIDFDREKLLPLLSVLMLELRIPMRFMSPVESLIVFGSVLYALNPLSIEGIRNQANRKFLYNPKIEPYPPPFGRMRFVDSHTNFYWYMKNKMTLMNSKSIEAALPLIILNKKMNKVELFKAIEDQWEQLETAMNDYELSNPYTDKLSHIPLKRLQEDMEIYRLRKVNTSYKEIQLKLKEDMNILFEEETIRKKHSELKKLLKELGFVKK